MADDLDVSNNPFAALFPSTDQAQMYIANKKLQIQHDLDSSIGDINPQIKSSTLDESDVIALAQRTKEINALIESIFLITIDKESVPDASRPARCVYMQGLAETMEEQTWLDMNSIEHAVFERLLLENPGVNVIHTQLESNKPEAASLAGEKEVLRYLYQCYERCTQAQQQKMKINYDAACDKEFGRGYSSHSVIALVLSKRFDNLNSEINQCFEVILLNAKTCLQQPDLYPSQVPHIQFVDLYMEQYSPLSENNLVIEFFLKVSKEIDQTAEDGSLSQVFGPVLEDVHKKLRSNSSLMNPEVNRHVQLLSFFTRTAPLAAVLMEKNEPTDWSKGRDYEHTILGSLLSLSCIPPEDSREPEFFINPSTTPKHEHDITEKNVWQPLSSICETVYHLMFSIIKLSPDLRHKMLTWLGKCIQANSGRAKIWTSQAPQAFSKIYCSDGFSLNLSFVLLKFCVPFSEASSPKLLKIQSHYTQAVASNDKDSQNRGIHSEGLLKETCLIPMEEGTSSPVSSSETYNFITECFFLCHQAIYQGFHAAHEKFLKINQELHRIQRTYQDMRASMANEEDGPLRFVKLQMEKGMTLFLSLKAALTVPELMEMSMKFHLASASWLNQMATMDDVTTFEPIQFPLPDVVPTSLAYIPEFIMGNITDFTMFLHRFKDELFESCEDRLQHFMTLILVFMGSPERMKNPHLRAELAETLAALMPENPDMTNEKQSILSRYCREQLFNSHPLIRHLPEKLLHVFVSIEMTGQSVQFEQKFNYRRPMYMVLHYIWTKEVHRDAIKRLAAYSEEHIEDADAPLFLRFINLLINDAIFLLDEALDFMKQLKEKQQIKDGPEWERMDTRQKQELEGNMRQLGMMARYHNVMGNKTILTLAMLTREIKTIFCHQVMVDRIAGMLNYFLLHLVGPKQRDLKVKDKNEYEFKPDQLVSDIITIYLNLSEKDNFCRAVCNDGRSYSQDLFPKAVRVLQKIGCAPNVISDFESLHEHITKISRSIQEEDELTADAPEEFLDPIMGVLMKDPVRLPSSGNIVDRSVIARHILSDQMDPFNRAPLTLDMVEPMENLRNKIEAWIQEQRHKKNGTES